MRDNRRSAKQPRQLPPWVSTFLLGLIIIGIVMGMRTVVKAFERKAQINASTHITGSSLGPVYTSSGETIKVYVFVDPETDIQYLVSDRGGITPRLTNDTSYEEREL